MKFEYTDRDIDVKTETELPGIDWLGSIQLRMTSP